MAEYVDNEKLTVAVGEWAERVRNQINNKEPLEKMTDYIAESVFLICTNMGYKSSFIGYTYRADMISDAMENCIRYLKNFDIKKSNNAFGYISIIASFAFIRKIKKENKSHKHHLQYVKKMYTEGNIVDSLATDKSSEAMGYQLYIDYMQSIMDDMNIKDFEPVDRKTRSRKISSLDSIMTGEY